MHTVGQDEKIAALRPYATAINYKTDDFAERNPGQLTNDEGVDVILDIVGGPYFNRNLGLLKKGWTTGHHRLYGRANRS